VADRSGYILNPSGLNRAELQELVDAKQAGRKVVSLPGGVASAAPSGMVEAALDYRLARPILVDVSDSGMSHEAFLAALNRGCDVATANKKPLADDPDIFASLQGAAATQNRFIRAEATVGAGLPVIDTLEMLLATGDQLKSARGCLSGTLGYLMSALENGTSFSDAVKAAVDLGYTEPDPVAYLSGIDVARKATILARLAGFPSANKPVQLEGLVDASLEGQSLETLFAHLETLDEAFKSKIEAAKANGQVLRFVAEVNADHIKVGPIAVPAASPLGGLQGSDNMIVFESDRYNDRPLVITGPGAGIDVTAMGVLGDILRIAAERRQP
jgi:aspartokinase/homoserine dehydrogenase 1